MNSLKFYVTLRVHGRKAYGKLIGRQLALANQFAQWVRSSDTFELVLDPQLTIVNFRVKDPALSGTELASAHAQIVEEVNRDGQRWISNTVVNGRSVVRMMVISYLTTEQHLAGLQDALAAASHKILTAGAKSG